MNKIKLNVPDGVRYIGQWVDFGAQLPNDCHFILNKVLTGVGATQYYLTSNEPVVLCSPRCALLESKRKKHPDVWYYRDLADDGLSVDSDKPKATKKKATYEDIKKFNDGVRSYLDDCAKNRKAPKIMVTYDSLGHVIDVLRSNRCLNYWTLVIDEFQCIYTDAAYKSKTELEFLGNCKMFKRAVYLSATPYLEAYMEQLDEFKAMPYYELVWPENMKEQVTITNITLTKSATAVCIDIIDKMRAGKTVRFGNKEIDTTEAVFYLNKVSDICRIISKCQLRPDEVNILCAKDNEAKIKALGHQMGDFPKEGDPHKMFTFCTRTSFLGVDFYSECAYSYIFADPTQKTLALDISTDITQIIGRQRLERNPYRNEAIMFIKESAAGMGKDDIGKYIENKKNSTVTLIDSFNASSEKVQAELVKVYRKSAERDHFQDNYVAVIDDKATGKPKLVLNMLVLLSELRAWDIRKNGYRNVYVVIDQQRQAGITGNVGTKSTNPDVLAFKADFESTHDTTKRITAYCNFRQQHPELTDELDFVSVKYADYWDALGYDNIKALGFQESKIKAALAMPSPFDNKLPEVVKAVRANLQAGKAYTVAEMKKALVGVYREVDYPHAAKASDITNYVSAKLKQDSKTGMRHYVISSLHRKEITFFPFVWRPNVPMSADIDRLLDIIKTGKYQMKKSEKESRSLPDVIAEIRSLSDHEAQNRLKREWLPVACINGTFKYKHDHGLDTYSSFLALDFDGFTSDHEMTEAKEALKAYPYIYAIFDTPSGKGIKAIVIHDSATPAHHWNLYTQVMNACRLPQTDSSVCDLSRGQFFSYDPNLWVAPSPVPFHFEYDDTLQPLESAQDKTVIVGSPKDMVSQQLDIWTANFLHDLWNKLLTDDAIIARLDKHWTEKRPEYFMQGKRHTSMLTMAGTLCKAGIAKEKTETYLTSRYSNMPNGEIQDVIDFAYDHNAFGCDRRQYKR